MWYGGLRTRRACPGSCLHAANWVAEHLGASSRRPRHPFPAPMAGGGQPWPCTCVHGPTSNRERASCCTSGHHQEQRGIPGRRIIDLQSSPRTREKKVNRRMTPIKSGIQETGKETQKGQAGSHKTETTSRTQARAQARQTVTSTTLK